MARLYARVVGIVVILIGVLGLILGEELLAGAFNIDIVEDIVHLASGALLLYAGFAARDAGLVRNIVGGLGVVYLLVGLLGFVVPDLFGLLPHEYTIYDNLLHLVLGILGIVAAWVVKDTRTGTAMR